MRDSKFIVFKTNGAFPKLLELIEDVAHTESISMLDELLAKTDKILADLNAEIDSDEPCFVLRAQDKYAPEAIISYAERCRWGGASESHVRRALEIRGKMKYWQDANPEKVKVPD